ncbi:MAG: hypothetical protein OYH77_06050 [Pseudomonadota bacterium]|nr:hypothetical protein [Pseudomonadota bacterium]
MFLRLLLVATVYTAGIAYADTEPDFKKFLHYYASHSKIFAGLDSKPSTAKNLLPLDRQQSLLKLGLYHLNRAIKQEGEHKHLRRSLRAAAGYLQQAMEVSGEQDIKAQAVLHLAITQTLLGNDTARYYYRMAHKLARSELRYYVNLAYAEHLYAQQQYRQAERRYKKSVAYRQHPSYPYSVYKLAWLYNHLSHTGYDNYHQKAVNSLKLLVSITAKDSRFISLQHDALRALAMIWSNSPDGALIAKSYFTTAKHKQYYYLTLENSARKFVNAKRLQQAVDAYKTLLSEGLDSIESPRYLQAMLDLLRQNKRYHDMIFYLRRAEKIYFSKNSSWQAANVSHPQRIYWMNYVEDMIYKVGKDFYALGTQMSDISMYTHARHALLEYLKISHNDKNLMHAKFLLAEILFEFKYYDQAATYYYDVLSAHTLDQELAKLAGISAIKSLKRVIYEQLNMLHDSEDSTRVATEQQLKKIILSYLNLFTDQHERGLLLDVARLELKHHNFNQAAQHLKALTVRHGKSLATATGLSEYLLALEGGKRWQEIIAWVDEQDKKQIQSMPAAVQQLVADKYKLARLNHGLNLHKDKKHRQAAVWLREYQRLFPADDHADYVTLLAADNFYQVGDINAALAMYGMLVTDYPNSASYAKAVRSLAMISERIGDFATAAEHYYSLGKGGEQDALPLLEKAMQMFSNLHMYDKAATVAQLIVQKNQSLPAGFYRRLSDLYFKMGRYDDVWKLYRERLVYTRALFNPALIDVFKNRGDTDKIAFMAKTLTQREQTQGLTGDEQHLLAKIKFLHSQILIERFMLLELSDLANPDDEIKALQSEVLKIVAATTAVVEVGDPHYKVKSLYALGELYQGFASMITHALALTGETGVESAGGDNSRQQATALLLLEEASKYYQASYSQALASEQFNTDMLRAYDKLSQVNPNKYPETIEQYSEPLYFAHDFYVHKPIAGLM